MRLIQKEQPWTAARALLPVEALEKFPGFMEVLDREFSQRKVRLSDSLRVEIAATAAWIGSDSSGCSLTWLVPSVCPETPRPVQKLLRDDRPPD